MRRLRLAKAVPVTGRDVFNRECTLTIGPHNHGGDSWVWRTPDADVIMSPHIFRPAWGRTLVMSHGKCAFHEPEHSLFPHLFGLRNVYLELRGSKWPPYMCSEELWEKISPHLCSDGQLKPYAPTNYYDRQLNRGMLRAVTCLGQENGLRLTAAVDYGPGRVSSYTLSVLKDGLPEWERQVSTLVRARTLGRPRALRAVAQLVTHLPLLKGERWPHSDKVMWLQKDSPIEKYGELAAHKVLDAAILSFAAPEAHFLSAEILLSRSNHPMDLVCLQAISPQKVVGFRKVA